MTLPTPHDFHALARTCEEIAVANGFAPATWEIFPQRVAFAITELHEMREAAHGIGDDPVHVELADVAIRVFGTLSGVWGDDWHERLNSRFSQWKADKPPGKRYASIEEHLWPILGWFSKALDFWSKDREADAKQCLELALLEAFRLSDLLEVDLLAAIYDKCAVNRTRAKLHGKARATC